MDNGIEVLQWADIFGEMVGRETCIKQPKVVQKMCKYYRSGRIAPK